MTPAVRRLVRQLATLWATVALVELALWWLLWRNAYLQPLFRTPALLAPVVGVLATLAALRRRSGDDRRHRHERRG